MPGKGKAPALRTAGVHDLLRLHVLSDRARVEKYPTEVSAMTSMGVITCISSAHVTCSHNSFIMHRPSQERWQIS